MSARADLMTKYNLEASASEVIVEYDQKEKTLGVDDLYNMNIQITIMKKLI